MPERVSEYMPERMSDRMSDRMPEYRYIMIHIYIYPIYTYYVRIVSKAGDHSKKVISMFFPRAPAKGSS